MLADVIDFFFLISIAKNIMLDYSKAFDMINHGVLLAILHHVVMNDEAMQKFVSFLLEKSQLIKIKNNLSLFRTKTLDIPQDSILGPLLFVICTSSFVHPLYADDTQLFCSFEQTEMDICDS